MSLEALLAGLVAGGAHVASGPDHLAALAPLAVANRRRALWVGAAWGVGHGLAVILLGTAGLLFRRWVPLEALSAWSEVLVGLLLLGLGAWALVRSSRLVVHSHPHRHRPNDEAAASGALAHHHPHVHPTPKGHEVAGAHAGHHLNGALGVGFLHGTAGLGHLVGVLPSLALARLGAAIYLGAYLGGAVVAMMAFGWALGWITRSGGEARLRLLLRATGGAALLVGIYWLLSALP